MPGLMIRKGRPHPVRLARQPDLWFYPGMPGQGLLGFVAPPKAPPIERIPAT